MNTAALSGKLVNRMGLEAVRLECIEPRVGLHGLILLAAIMLLGTRHDRGINRLAAPRAM